MIPDVDDQDSKTISTQVAHKFKRAIVRGTGAHLTADKIHFLGNSAYCEWIESMSADMAI